MVDYEYPDFSDREYWEKEVLDFIEYGGFGEQTLKIWQYFKYCLGTRNRFFFQHQLYEMICEKLKEYCFDLPVDTVLYRARVDVDEVKDAEAGLYFLTCNIPEKLELLKRGGVDEKGLLEIEEELMQPTKEPGFSKIRERIENGFEGFDALGSGAPPAGESTEGRCNSIGVPFLYAAKEEHTAIAEVRPLVRSSISMATIRTNKPLNLVDFYYEYDESGIIKIDDMFYHCIRMEFSKLNKGDKREYLATQYITALAEYLGYDGIRFRSSLVEDGTNYVIFEQKNYQVESSKLYRIYDVEYKFEPSHINYF